LLETNQNALCDKLNNLTAAESQNRDADLAPKTAAPSRPKILVQSGTTMLPRAPEKQNDPQRQPQNKRSPLIKVRLPRCINVKDFPNRAVSFAMLIL
jgi:hypothetical protein